MTELSTKPASGMRDFLADDVQRRRQVMDVVRDVYESYGFEPLETPSMERLKTLLGKYGEEGEKLIFRIMKRGEKLERAIDAGDEQLADLGLRYDLTVPLARVVAEHRNDISLPYKRYQIAPVWRADRPQKGRYREFYQCDLDIVGTEAKLAEVEVANASAEILNKLGFKDFRIHLNHKSLLQGFLDFAEVPESLREDALIAIDKQDKIGLDGVESELESRGLSAEAVGKLMSLLELGANRDVDPGQIANSHVLEALVDKLAEIEGVESAVADLQDILEFVGDGPASEHLYVDPSLARGLSYYTGPLFEIRSDAFSGSIGAGGRYDDLIGMFAGREYPACGLSLGIERILVIMEENEMFDGKTAPADVVVTRWSDELTSTSVEITSAFRQKGLRADLYSDTDGLGKQFGYADKRDVPYVAIIAPDEAEAGDVTMKDMETGDQKTIPQQEAPEWLADRCL
jgi:histidyl-tRNA synthetase